LAAFNRALYKEQALMKEVIINWPKDF